MPKKKLDLFKLSTGIVTESRTGSSKIMWRELSDLHAGSSFLDNMPNRLFRDASPQSVSARQTHRNSGPLSISAATSHSSSVHFTQAGTGTVRMCLPLPTRSTMAQRSSRRCRLSYFNSASSRRRSPQPSKIAKMARLRFPVSVCSVGRLPEGRRLTCCQPVAQTRS
jgi:hypothetical protein